MVGEPICDLILSEEMQTGGRALRETASWDGGALQCHIPKRYAVSLWQV
jgi:hypothetical protein